ncbi:MAG: flagellar hook-length control protein FliK [Candidatus Wallbacteria bacterium]|nr:flagellar hook-length control protein FliK [Candidatus Wallbacteria bacterium]
MKIDSSQGIGFKIPANGNPGFRIGEVCSGKVIGFYEGKPVINFSDGKSLTAVSSEPLKIGDHIEGRVTGIEDGTVFIKLTGQERGGKDPSEAAVKEEILRLGMQNDSVSTELIRQAMRAGVKLERREIVAAMNIKNHTGVDFSDLLRLVKTAGKLGLQPNQESIFIARLLRDLPATGKILDSVAPKEPLLGELLARLSQSSPDSGELKDIFRMFSGSGAISGMLNELSDRSGEGQLMAQHLLGASDSSFAWQDLPFFPTSREDRAELYWKKKKNSESDNGIFSFVLYLDTKELGKISFQGILRKKQLSLKAYTDNYLSLTLLKSHLPQLADRLGGLGFSVVREQAFYRENLTSFRERVLSDRGTGEIDFIA